VSLVDEGLFSGNSQTYLYYLNKGNAGFTANSVHVLYLGGWFSYDITVISDVFTKLPTQNLGIGQNTKFL
jgi:hypothetical protein